MYNHANNKQRKNAIPGIILIIAVVVTTTTTTQLKTPNTKKIVVEGSQTENKFTASPKHQQNQLLSNVFQYEKKKTKTIITKTQNPHQH